MNKLETLPDSICAFLSAQTAFSDLSFVTAYSGTKKMSPLKKITVAVGVKELKISSCAIGSAVSADEERPCKQAKIKIAFNIFTPFSKNANEGCALVSKIFNKLIFDSPLNIIECGFSEIKTDSAAEAFLTEAFADIKTTVTRGTSDA